MWKGSLVLSCAVIGLCVTSSFAEPVRWRNGDVLPGKMSRAAVQQKTNSLKMLNAQDGPRKMHVVVQLDEVVTSQQKDALAAKGVKLLQSLGGNIYFAAFDAASVDPAGLVQQKVSGIHEIEPGWKLHNRLAANQPPQWSVVSRKADGQMPDSVAVYVVLHPDVDRASARPVLTTRHNMTIKSEVEQKGDKYIY